MHIYSRGPTSATDALAYGCGWFGSCAYIMLNQWPPSLFQQSNCYEVCAATGIIPEAS